MKFTYLFFVFVQFFCMNLVYSMESEVSNNTETEEADVQLGREILNAAKKFAGLGMVIGGWGFAAGSSKKFAHLPYALRRAPLMVFLASSTLMQLPNIFRLEQNHRLASIGRYSRKVSEKSFSSVDNPYSP